MILAPPAHIRQLAEDVTADGRSVLADWLEEQGEVATAESLRAGGIASQIVMLSLFAERPDELSDMVFIRGESVFTWCHVDLSFTIRESMFDHAHSTARARVRGMPQDRARMHDEGRDPVLFLVRNMLVSVQPHEWTWTYAARERGLLDVEVSGSVISRQAVDRSTGTPTQATP